MKDIHMAFKNILGSKDAPSKDAPDDKSKAAPASNQPVTEPDADPAKAAPGKSS
jgi:hypothetical protein